MHAVAMRGLLLFAIACSAPEPGKGETADSADSADSAGYNHDTSDTADTGSDALDPSVWTGDWCADWEDGTLARLGYGDVDFVELMDGAIVANIEEGGDWSALRGEEMIPLSGDRAVILRSSHEGEPESMAGGVLGPFLVEQPALTWLQLSEVRAEGLWLGASLLDEDLNEIAAIDLPVETGGFIPGLEERYRPIEGLDEIVVSEGTPGEPVAQGVDLSPWMGEVVSVRFNQHTMIDDNGFFTLLDDLCPSPGTDLDLLDWGAPRPSPGAPLSLRPPPPRRSGAARGSSGAR